MTNLKIQRITVCPKLSTHPHTFSCNPSPKIIHLGWEAWRTLKSVLQHCDFHSSVTTILLGLLGFMTNSQQILQYPYFHTLTPQGKQSNDKRRVKRNAKCLRLLLGISVNARLPRRQVPAFPIAPYPRPAKPRLSHLSRRCFFPLDNISKAGHNTPPKKRKEKKRSEEKRRD